MSDVRQLFGPWYSRSDVTPPRLGSGAPDGADRRLQLDPEDVERGLAQLVLTVVELLRQLMERQALLRLEAGTLTAGQEEQLGLALMRLANKMEELKAQFDLTDEDLDLRLGRLDELV